MIQNAPLPSVDERIQQIRHILNRAAHKVCGKQRLYSLASDGNALAMTESGFSKFLAEGGGLKAANFRALEHFLFRSSKGRALIALLEDDGSFFDEIEQLASAEDSKLLERDIAGLYFFYHTSYVEEPKAVVRVLEISLLPNGTLGVVDTCKDLIDPSEEKVYVSRGCILAGSGTFQILLNATQDDRRIGIQIINCTDVSPTTGRINSFMGTMSGLKDRGSPFHRACYAVRCRPKGQEPSALRAEMISRTGAQFVMEHDKDHREVFSRLARLPEKLMASDPVFTHDDYKKLALKTA